MNLRHDHIPLHTSLLYVGLASAWIVISDLSAAHIGGESVAFFLSNVVKGLAFVMVTALALYVFLRRRNKELVESERRLGFALQSARLGTWDWDMPSMRIHFDDRWASLVGYSRDSLEPHMDTWKRLTHPEDVGEVLGRIEQCLSRGEETFSNLFRMRHQSGHWVWIKGFGQVIDRDETGRATRIIGIHMDVSDQRLAEQALIKSRVHLEREVAERTIELQSALKRVEAADKLKSAFLATMSHEIRTPLNSVIGFAGILLDELPGPLNSEQRKQLEMILNSGKSLLDLINDVLDLSKIEAGQLELFEEEVDIVQSVEKCMEMMRPQMLKRRLDLEIKKADSVPLIQCDRRRLEQVLLNLLSNACKYTETGGIKIEVRPSAFAHMGIPACRISVSDTGIGIQGDCLDKIFLPFYRLNGAKPSVEGSSGLGLAICKRLVDAMQGELTVESAPGAGSTFTLYLPTHKGGGS